MAYKKMNAKRRALRLVLATAMIAWTWFIASCLQYMVDDMMTAASPTWMVRAVIGASYFLILLSCYIIVLLAFAKSTKNEDHSR